MNDIQLTAAMRQLLEEAKRLMPESVFCLVSYTNMTDDAGEELIASKVVTNLVHTEELCQRVCITMHAMTAVPAVDLRDCQGGMQ